ncbi:MAG: hypothetical protein IKN65_08020 [Clostridia bacterium]|nr:hypothetical protein [Clostridia bacterium]
MDGLYEFNIKSPMGNIKALVKLITNGNNLSGYVDVMGKRNEFNNGSISGNNLSLKGKISAGMMNIQYTIIGNVQGDVLNLAAQTNIGNFNLQGKRIS